MADEAQVNAGKQQQQRSSWYNEQVCLCNQHTPTPVPCCLYVHTASEGARSAAAGRASGSLCADTLALHCWVIVLCAGPDRPCHQPPAPGALPAHQQAQGLHGG